MGLPTVTLPQNGKACITTITSHRDLDMAVFSLTSFFYASGLRFPLYIIDDGTLTTQDFRILNKHIKNVRILNPDKHLRTISAKLKKYAYCHKYRHENLYEKFYAIKLFDPFLLPDHPKLIYLDSDILFIRKPAEIIQWLESNNKYSLFATEYRYDDPALGLAPEWRYIEAMFSEKMGNRYPEHFNSGLICLNKSDYNLSVLNKSLQYIYRVGLENSWCPEQYSLGALIARTSHKNLKHSYIHLTRNALANDATMSQSVCLHFAYKSRPLYYSTAFRLALQTGLFRT